MQILALECADAVFGGDRSFVLAGNRIDEREYVLDVRSLSGRDEQVQIAVADVTEHEIDNFIEASREFPIDFYQQDAHDFAALMESIGCQTYAVGGWSDGAITSMLLTLAYPQQVTKMAVWGGNAYISPEDIEAYEKTRSVSDWSPRMAAPLQAIYGDDFQELWSRWCDAQQALLKAGGDLCRERVSRITCPTFLIHGGKDPLVPLLHAPLQFFFNQHQPIISKEH